MGTEESADAIVPGRAGKGGTSWCEETDRMNSVGVEPQEGMTDQPSLFGERAGNPVGAREGLATKALDVGRVAPPRRWTGHLVPSRIPPGRPGPPANRREVSIPRPNAGGPVGPSRP